MNVCVFQAKEKASTAVQPDEPVVFSQLSSRSSDLAATENMFELSLSQAVVGSHRDGVGKRCFRKR